MTNVVLLFSALGFVGSAVLSIVALFVYLKQPGASAFGFGYARFFYGEYRRTRPALFWGVFVSLAAGFAGNVVMRTLLSP